MANDATVRDITNRLSTVLTQRAQDNMGGGKMPGLAKEGLAAMNKAQQTAPAFGPGSNRQGVIV